MIPAYSFDQTANANSITRTRSGAVLRVWLERPWYSSGPGELLGVLVDGSPGDVPVTTRYGRDPVAEGPGTATPTLDDFPRATSTQNSVTPGIRVAGHEVVFDPERKLWYCDIEIDADLGYRPFVRLSVARYQPIVIDGAYVSTTVDLEQVRLGLVQDREVSKHASGDLVVTLTGHEHDGIPDETSGGALLFNTVNGLFPEGDCRSYRPGSEVARLERAPSPPPARCWPTGRPAGECNREPRSTARFECLIEESEPVMQSDGSGNPVAASEVVYVETVTLSDAFLN